MISSYILAVHCHLSHSKIINKKLAIADKPRDAFVQYPKTHPFWTRYHSIPTSVHPGQTVCALVGGGTKSWAATEPARPLNGDVADP